MQQILRFLTVFGLAVIVIGWCVVFWSQLQMQDEILLWARNMNGCTRINIFVMFRPDLLTLKGQKFRKRILLGLSLFFAGMLFIDICHVLGGKI